MCICDNSLFLPLFLSRSTIPQVAWKLDETKKYYSMYNTLDTTLSFLQKEVKLLNSIGGSCDEAMQNPQSTREYLSQAESIIKGLEVGTGNGTDWTAIYCDLLSSHHTISLHSIPQYSAV